MPRKAYLYGAVAMAAVGLVSASIFFLPVGPEPQGSTTSATTTSTSTSPRYSDAVVVIEGAGDDAQYNPQVLTVVVGVNNTVVWINSGSISHTVTSTDHTASGAPLFDSGNMNAGAEYSHTFLQPGTYDYYCVYHGTMQGEVIVLAHPQ